jgi:hypothetical protein
MKGNPILTIRKPAVATDLKHAAVPGDGVGEGFTRHQGGKKRGASGPAEGPDRRRDQQDEIEEREREIVEMKRWMALEEGCDRAEQIVASQQNR